MYTREKSAVDITRQNLNQEKLTKKTSVIWELQLDITNVQGVSKTSSLG